MPKSAYFIERPSGGERVILVQIAIAQPIDFASLLAEFNELARSAALTVVDAVTGKRHSPTANYFIGRGKAEEIAALVKQHQADVVLFNHELTPAQGRNLEQLFTCRVIDRTELILDIFAQRARSAEGKLQVELAQLQHLRTRLIRGWTHLERQKGGIGLRGPGETQLETDRRLIDVRIKALQKRLQKLAVQRDQRRRGRQRALTPTVSLVGYTNAGKSTLFNRLTEAHVYVADQLFATLDPTLRQIQLSPIGDVILIDTVGFIRELPHDLIAAFHATLEETCQADLLLHVVDSSHPNYQEMLTNVHSVLQEIGADTIPCIEVYNKIDLQCNPRDFLERSSDGYPQRVGLSAVTGQGIDVLRDAMAQILQDPVLDCEVILPVDASKLRAELYSLGAVKAESMDENGQYILQLHIRRVDCHRLLQGKIIKYQ